MNATPQQARFRRRLLAAAAALPLAGPWAARAQDKVVRLILPHATGSGVDAITRGAQNALAKALGAAVVVDNRPAPAASSACRRWRARRPTAARCRWCRTMW